MFKKISYKSLVCLCLISSSVLAAVSNPQLLNERYDMMRRFGLLNVMLANWRQNQNNPTIFKDVAKSVNSESVSPYTQSEAREKIMAFLKSNGQLDDQTLSRLNAMDALSKERIMAEFDAEIRASNIAALRAMLADSSHLCIKPTCPEYEQYQAMFTYLRASDRNALLSQYPQLKSLSN